MFIVVDMSVDFYTYLSVISVFLVLLVNYPVMMLHSLPFTGPAGEVLPESPIFDLVVALNDAIHVL
jgi:hypothetical protein